MFHEEIDVFVGTHHFNPTEPLNKIRVVLFKIFDSCLAITNLIMSHRDIVPASLKYFSISLKIFSYWFILFTKTQDKFFPNYYMYEITPGNAFHPGYY